MPQSRSINRLIRSMSSADTPAARVFMPYLAHPWPGLAEARAQFSGPAQLPEPVAELAGGDSPSRFLSLKEFRGAVIIPPGPPMIVGNVWLCYPGRRHAVTARTSTLLFDRDEDGVSQEVFEAWSPRVVEFFERGDDAGGDLVDAGGIWTG